MSSLVHSLACNSVNSILDTLKCRLIYVNLSLSWYKWYFTLCFRTTVKEANLFAS